MIPVLTCDLKFTFRVGAMILFSTDVASMGINSSDLCVGVSLGQVVHQRHLLNCYSCRGSQNYVEDDSDQRAPC